MTKKYYLAIDDSGDWQDLFPKKLYGKRWRVDYQMARENAIVISKSRKLEVAIIKDGKPEPIEIYKNGKLQGEAAVITDNP